MPIVFCLTLVCQRKLILWTILSTYLTLLAVLTVQNFQGSYPAIEVHKIDDDDEISIKFTCKSKKAR